MNNAIVYPWMPFTQFMEIINGIGEIPIMFESKKMNLPRVYGDQLTASLRFLGFANELNVPTDKFKEFFLKKDQRSELMKDALFIAYSEVFGLVESSANITDEVLRKVFSNRTPAESTIRKMMSFFKQAALFANIPISASSRAPKTRNVNAEKDKGDEKHNAKEIDKPNSPSTTREIQLKSGGATLKVTVTVNDPFALYGDEEDHKLIADITNLLNGYMHKWLLK